VPLAQFAHTRHTLRLGRFRACRHCAVTSPNILLTPYHTLAELREAAEEAVAEITARVDVMRQNGDLKLVNAQYKRYRAEQMAKAEKATPYAVFLQRFTASIVRDVAMGGR
jgi:hypothetical protein